MKSDVFVIINKKYNTLSKVNKKIADYVIENHATSIFMSISELSSHAKVSPASITRFCKELGYSGFTAFQKDLQSIVKKEVIDRKEIRMSLQDDKTEDVLADILNNNIENLKATLTEELSKAFDKSIEAIVNAESVYIVGLRSSYTVAYYFYFLLREIRDGVHLLTLGTGDFYDQAINVNSNSVLVAIGFPNYTKETCHIVEFFSNNKATVISVTDSYSSPLSVLADITLVAVNKKNTYSFVSAMSILNAAVFSIGRVDSKKTLERLDRKEAIIKAMKIHI